MKLAARVSNFLRLPEFEIRSSFCKMSRVSQIICVFPRVTLQLRCNIIQRSLLTRRLPSFSRVSVSVFCDHYEGATTARRRRKKRGGGGGEGGGGSGGGTERNGRRMVSELSFILIFYSSLSAWYVERKSEKK